MGFSPSQSEQGQRPSSFFSRADPPGPRPNRTCPLSFFFLLLPSPLPRRTSWELPPFPWPPSSLSLCSLPLSYEFSLPNFLSRMPELPLSSSLSFSLSGALSSSLCLPTVGRSPASSSSLRPFTVSEGRQWPSPGPAASRPDLWNGGEDKVFSQPSTPSRRPPTPPHSTSLPATAAGNGSTSSPSVPSFAGSLSLPLPRAPSSVSLHFLNRKLNEKGGEFTWSRGREVVVHALGGRRTVDNGGKWVRE